jgi:DNA-binding transcriptional MocR family regulator
VCVDDPYFYLYYGKAPRYPSYFALELEGPEVGHVLRFDSLSKVLSAGIRIGFASGPEALLRAIDQHVCSMPIPSFLCRAHNDTFSSISVLIPAPIPFICMNNPPTTVAN